MATRDRPLYRMLEDDTTPGAVELAVDGSVTAVTFQLVAPAGSTYIVHAVRLVLESSALDLSDPAQARAFGAAGVLANGITFKAQQQGDANVLFVEAVTVLGDLYRYADQGLGLDVHVDAVAAGTDLLVMTMTFPTPIELHYRTRDLGLPDRLALAVQDDLTGLTAGRAFAVGVERVRY